MIGASPVETLVAVSNALDRAPVYVHLDLDVIDPEQMPAQFPAPGRAGGGEAVRRSRGGGRDVGAGGPGDHRFEAPDDPEERALLAETVMHVLEPLLAVVPEEAGVGG